MLASSALPPSTNVGRSCPLAEPFVTLVIRWTTHLTSSQPARATSTISPFLYSRHHHHPSPSVLPATACLSMSDWCYHGNEGIGFDPLASWSATLAFCCLFWNTCLVTVPLHVFLLSCFTLCSAAYLPLSGYWYHTLVLGLFLDPLNLPTHTSSLKQTLNHWKCNESTHVCYP